MIHPLAVRLSRFPRLECRHIDLFNINEPFITTSKPAGATTDGQSSTRLTPIEGVRTIVNYPIYKLQIRGQSLGRVPTNCVFVCTRVTINQNGLT